MRKQPLVSNQRFCQRPSRVFFCRYPLIVTISPGTPPESDAIAVCVLVLFGHVLDRSIGSVRSGSKGVDIYIYINVHGSAILLLLPGCLLSLLLPPFLRSTRRPINPSGRCCCACASRPLLDVLEAGACVRVHLWINERGQFDHPPDLNVRG